MDDQIKVGSPEMPTSKPAERPVPEQMKALAEMAQKMLLRKAPPKPGESELLILRSLEEELQRAHGTYQAILATRESAFDAERYLKEIKDRFTKALDAYEAATITAQVPPGPEAKVEHIDGIPF